MCAYIIFVSLILLNMYKYTYRSKYIYRCIVFINIKSCRYR